MLSEFEEIVYSVLTSLDRMVKLSRGTAVTFKCKNLARTVVPKPVVLTVIKHILEEFRKKGYIDVWSVRRIGETGRGVSRYILTKDSPLWKFLKNATIEDLQSYMENILKNNDYTIPTLAEARM